LKIQETSFSTANFGLTKQQKKHNPLAIGFGKELSQTIKRRNEEMFK
jgi:hypothetical protein